MPKIVFDFTDDAYQDILRLQQAQEAATLGEVVQVALSLYTAIHLVMARGWRVGIIHNGEILKEIDLP